MFGRYGKQPVLAIQHWFMTHIVFQTIGLILAFFGFFWIFAHIQSWESPHFAKTHNVLGLITFICLILQFSLGFTQSCTTKAFSESRHLNMSHKHFGRLILLFSLVTIGFGFDALGVETSTFYWGYTFGCVLLIINIFVLDYIVYKSTSLNSYQALELHEGEEQHDEEINQATKMKSEIKIAKKVFRTVFFIYISLTVIFTFVLAYYVYSLIE